MMPFLLGFAQIKADLIPDGIMPKDKRQVVGTGATTSEIPPTTSDTPTATPEDTPTTTDVAPTTITEDDPTSDATPSTAHPTDDSVITTPTSVEADPTTDVSSPTEVSTTIPTSIQVTTTNADGSIVTSQVSTNTIAPGSTNRADNANSVFSTDSSDTNVVRVGSSTINRSTLDQKTVITSALLAKSTSRNIYTSYWTSDGQVYSSVVTEEQVYSSTTGFATATLNPSLANGGGDGSNLSDSAKKVIGGVVGGIGGAILIGGLAFVAWRLWGKKKAQAEDNDDTVWGGSRPDSIETAKRSSGMTAYDTYSNPGGRINTSSNF